MFDFVLFCYFCPIPSNPILSLLYAVAVQDETCVICNDCYQASDHEGHEVYFYHSVMGGCCDCGDAGAWSTAGNCCYHGGRYKDLAAAAGLRAITAPRSICEGNGKDEAEEEDDDDDNPAQFLPSDLRAKAAVLFADITAGTYLPTYLLIYLSIYLSHAIHVIQLGLKIIHLLYLTL